MENGTVNADTVTVVGAGAAAQAPKVKTQRTYHIHAKGNKGDLYTVIVYKGVLYLHPNKYAQDCNAVTFTPVAKAEAQVDSDGEVWSECPDPRK